MKYIKLFEKFTKDYQSRIELKDFKKIKKGSKIQYMGGPVEVVDNNGYVLKLKGDDGKIFTVNKSQFDHGGRISEVSDGKKKKKKKEFHPDMMYELRRDSLSGTMSGSTESLEDRKYELKKDVKGAQIGDFINVVLPKGTIIHNLPGGVFADHFSLKNKYASKSSRGPQYFEKPTFSGIGIRSMPDTLAAIEKNSKVLESVNEAKDNLYLQLHKKYAEQIKGLKAKKIKKLTDLVWVQRSSMEDREDYFDMDPKLKKSLSAEYNEERKLLKKYMARDYSVMLPKGTESLRESSSKDGGDKSNGNSHHDDHQEKSIAQEWKDTYGEEFHSKYPAIAKIIKQRNIKDKRELSRIWQDTYGENFEEQYPALFNKLD